MSWVLLYLKHRELIRAVMLVQVFALSVFAISILGRTMIGETAAITGANKWGTYSVLGLWLLSRPIHEVEEH
jgi:hypothetical protein